MKFLLLISILILNFAAVQAQQPCGTELTDAMKSRLMEYQLHKTEFAGAATDRVARYVPIKFHIVGKSNGSGHYRLAYIWPLLCELNMKYAFAGIYFYVYDDIHYIDNDDYYDHDFNSGDQMMNQNNVDGVINVYIVDDPAGYCGYYTYGPDAVTVAKSCNAPGSTTLAHELGHYFSLPHPFDIVGSQKEFVNGTNCSYAGDMFCDTRADFLDYRWNCPYNGTDTDPNGDVYDPDETLFMSYSYDNCQTRFSNEQIDAMNYNLSYERTDLLNYPAPDISPITSMVQLTYPIDSVNDVPHDFIQFKWEPVAGAVYYHLEVTRAPTFGSEPTELDLIIHGTAFTTALEPNKKYNWRVIPLKDGYTCTSWSQKETFFTVLGTGIHAIQTGQADLRIFPEIVSAGKSLSISFNASQSGKTEYYVISSEGLTCSRTAVNCIAGENTWKVPTGGLAAGMYLIVVASDRNLYQQKVIVTK